MWACPVHTIFFFFVFVFCCCLIWNGSEGTTYTMNSIITIRGIMYRRREESLGLLDQSRQSVSGSRRQGVCHIWYTISLAILCPESAWFQSDWILGQMLTSDLVLPTATDRISRLESQSGLWPSERLLQQSHYQDCLFINCQRGRWNVCRLWPQWQFSLPRDH